MFDICRDKNKRTVITRPRYLHKLRVSKRGHEPPIDRLTLHQRISTWSILEIVENKHQKRQPCPSSCLWSVAPTIVGFDLVDDARKVPVLIPARLPQRTPRHSAEPDVIDPAGDAVRVRAKGRTSGYAGPSWGALSS